MREGGGDQVIQADHVCNQLDRVRRRCVEKIIDESRDNAGWDERDEDARHPVDRVNSYVERSTPALVDELAADQKSAKSEERQHRLLAEPGKTEQHGNEMGSLIRR